MFNDKILIKYVCRIDVAESERYRVETKIRELGLSKQISVYSIDNMSSSNSKNIIQRIDSLIAEISSFLNE